MKITALNVAGAYFVETDRYHDSRGYFQEIHKDPQHFRWQQTNISVSARNVVRGLHCAPYGKFCTCIRGKLFDVMVDLRPDSTTYLNWEGIWLSEENHTQVYVPAGCGHGFYSAEDDSTLLYLQEGVYAPGNEVEVNWRDPTIKVEWPKADTYILSEKDQNAPFYGLTPKS